MWICQCHLAIQKISKIPYVLQISCIPHNLTVWFPDHFCFICANLNVIMIICNTLLTCQSYVITNNIHKGFLSAKMSKKMVRLQFLLNTMLHPLKIWLRILLPSLYFIYSIYYLLYVFYILFLLIQRFHRILYTPSNFLYSVSQRHLCQFNIVAISFNIFNCEFIKARPCVIITHNYIQISLSYANDLHNPVNSASNAALTNHNLIKNKTFCTQSCPYASNLYGIQINTSNPPLKY